MLGCNVPVVQSAGCWLDQDSGDEGLQARSGALQFSCS